MNVITIIFLLTRPLRGATSVNVTMPQTREISTHTPLAGRDRRAARNVWNVHEFLLTRPLRGATTNCIPLYIFGIISTHTPLAGRDHCSRASKKCCKRISTHTPLAGRDNNSERIGRRIIQFLLTRPLRGATNMDCMEALRNIISTHTPLAGRDR